MKKSFKIYIGEIGNKKDNDVSANMAQLEHNNNKCYALTFRSI